MTDKRTPPPHRADIHADAAPHIDTSVPHPARRYNYWLGGKDHFEADRVSGDAIARAYPSVRIAAVENRGFLLRAVRFLAQHGISQFLDVGAGLPGPVNVHDIAQQVDPTARVLYVDNDPIVGSHARALLTGDPHGHTDYLHADVRDPASILTSATLAATLDLSRPVGLLLVAVLHFLPDHDRPHELVAQLLHPLATGSHLVLSHGTADTWTDDQRAALPGLTAGDAAPYTPRSRDHITDLAAGLDLVEPGIVSVAAWRDDQRTDTDRPSHADVSCYGLVARKPGRLR
ncbi:SAM-dependent methyltransferase [Dactylosporangium sp. NPDC050688]|uniref:SAM-dependent methyltransferase n=1 Tax=Dactylosporangium sp. NPDC050688 TaxID=3157217 RepID=UPI0033C9221C